jgi:hypothetical protein
VPALVSIAGSFCFAFMMLSGRALRGTPDKVLVFWQLAGSGLLGLATAPFGWVQPGAIDLLLLALLGIVAMIAHVCVSRALKLADASVVAPFYYSMLLWALIFGFFVFGDVPRPTMLAGAVIIVAAGLYIARAKGRHGAYVRITELLTKVEKQGCSPEKSPVRIAPQVRLPSHACLHTKADILPVTCSRHRPCCRATRPGRFCEQFKCASAWRGAN